MKPLIAPLSRDKSDTLLLIATCLLVLAPHFLRLPGWVSLLSALLLMWRGWITFRGNRMPPPWLLVPIACAAMAAGYFSHRTFFGRDAGVTMLVLLLVLKLLEMRAKRDLFTVVFVSFFLLLANFFYSQSIAMAALMCVSVVALLVTQLSFQYTGLVPRLKKRLAHGAMIFALAAPVTLVLFVLFPRIQGPLWNLPSDAKAGRTGLSENMTPGNISDLASSEDVAFRVEFTDPMPPRANLYWRGPVLSSFDGRTWTRMPQPRSDSKAISVGWRGDIIRHAVTLEASGNAWLFALELPQQAPMVLGRQAGFSAEVEMQAARQVDQRVRYDVGSHIDFDLQLDLPEATLQRWLTLPAGFNPQTLAYAAQLRAQDPDPLRLVNVVLRKFRQEPFRYTMTPPLLGRDSVDEFLFGTRAGFCEHYASAFVVLMRAAGVPARVVTGYQGGEVNPVDGYLTVRQSDAHAWAEVWLAGKGWKRVDPTAAVAPQRVERNLGSVIPRQVFGGLLNLDMSEDTLLARVRFNFDAVTNQWNQWVLNYSADKQKDLLRSLGYTQTDWPSLIGLLFGGVSLALAIAVLPLIWNRQKVDPATALYHALCRDLARRGLPRALHEGPREYGGRIAAERRLPAPQRIAIGRFLSLYESLQYAPQPQRERTSFAFRSSHPTVAQLKSLLAQCR
jgi:transglutaminase-like putative cysteine protease